MEDQAFSGFNPRVYTQVSNDLFDQLLTQINSPSELKVTLAVIRQTAGYVDEKTGKRKSEDRLSLSRVMQLTGLCKQSAHEGLAKAVDRGSLILRVDGQKHFYSLKLVEDLDQSNRSTMQTGLESRPVTGLESRPKPVYKVDTQKKERKLLKENIHDDSAIAESATAATGLLIPFNRPTEKAESKKPGLRIVDIWESPDAAEKPVAPAVSATAAESDRPLRPVPKPGKPKPRRKAEASPPVEIPRPVAVFQSVFGKYPPKGLWIDIASKVGAEDQPVDRWQEVLKDWACHPNWNQFNVIGQLERFEKWEQIKHDNASRLENNRRSIMGSGRSFASKAFTGTHGRPGNVASTDYAADIVDRVQPRPAPKEDQKLVASYSDW